MSVHTPGPWIDGPQGILHARGFIAFTSPPREVSDALEPGEGWLDMRDRTHPAREAVAAEQRANARLIAAAPELLEALIDCRRALEIANFTQELAIVEAAIAKARGEQP